MIAANAVRVGDSAPRLELTSISDSYGELPAAIDMLFAARVGKNEAVKPASVLAPDKDDRAAATARPRGP
jgi:hypothetical protein